MAKRAVHGGDFFAAIGLRLDHLENRSGIVNADVLDAWYDPAPSVVEAIRQNLPWLIKTSPPTHGEGLVEVIAEARGLNVSNILLGAGSSSLIFLLFPRLFEGKKVGVLDPMYGEYAHVLGLCGAEVKRFELEAPLFRPDPQALAQFASELDGLVLVNPNSPTGVGSKKIDVMTLLAGVPPTVTVWIDETYIDFLPGAESVEGLVANHPNLIVCKSMSKYYALSGLRIGYCVANTALVDEAEEQTAPWSVGLIAQLAAAQALRDPDYYKVKVAETLALGKELAAGLTSHGYYPTPSDANFVLAHKPGGGVARLVERAALRGVYVRNCDSLSPRFRDDYVRVAVKTLPEQVRILEALS
ncbi:MAG: histidinol-phosphate transaminase [Armatimonadota bacterium]